MTEESKARFTSNPNEGYVAIIRLRGEIKARKDINDTMINLGMKKVNTLVIIKKNDSIMGMIKKIENFVSWGEVPKDVVKDNIIHLKPFKLKSKKLRYPEGNLGYRPDMAEFVKKVSQ